MCAQGSRAFPAPGASGARAGEREAVKGAAALPRPSAPVCRQQKTIQFAFQKGISGDSLENGFDGVIKEAFCNSHRTGHGKIVIAE